LIDNFKSGVFQMYFQPISGSGRWIDQERPKRSLKNSFLKRKRKGAETKTS